MSRTIAAAVIELIRSALHTADEALTPAGADEVYTALVAHIRARRPESVSPLSAWEPTEVPHDPRT